MLWSMLKALIFVAATALLAIGATYLLEIGDVALITVAGREFVLTPFVSVLLALAALVLVWVLMRLTGLVVAGIRFLNGDETALTRYFNRRSEKRGFEALSDSILALAAGEGHLAIRKAERAAKLLARPEVTNLLIAQGAEMAGDEARATEAFKALVQDERTRFVGVRGLLQQKLAAGDTDTALKLAEKALALRPKNADMQDTLLRLQAQYEDWAGARATLNAKLRSGTLPRDVHKRRDAVLALADAREALADGQIARATELAKSANRQSPSLLPAAVMAARMSIAEGKAKQAASVIQKAWGLAPHPDLAAAFAEIVPEETPEARIKRFRPLLKQHQGHREARLLEAELQIAAKEFGEARKALGSLGINTTTLTHTLTVAGDISASVNVSASAFYGDGTNLTNVNLPSATLHSSNFTVSSTADILAINSSGSVITASLPAANTYVSGQRLSFKDVGGSGSVNNIAIQPSGSETIDGSTAGITITTNYGAIELFSNGVNSYHILSTN